MSKNRRPLYLTLVIISAVVVGTALIIMWFKPNATESTSTTQIDGETTTSGLAPDMLNPYKGLTTPTTQGDTRFITGLEDLPRSLQGTKVDGEIIIDANKQLVVTEGLRRLFDYFLSALGEEDEATIIQRVESYIRNHTPEPAASQAVAIFNQYINYLKQLKQIEERYGNLQMQATKNGELDLNMVAQRQQDISKIRQQNFDAETIKAFFGADDEYDAYSISMLNIEQDKQLSDTQKAAARQDYVSRMPDNSTKANIQQQANLNELIDSTEQMKKQGATPEALYNMRRELVGEAAAGRLASVDQEDNNFDKRFNQYQAQKQQLLTQSANQSQTQTQTQINQIEQQLFNEAERKRLTGYAAMQQQKATETN